MKEPTLLLLAYHFPPENSIGAARPFRFFKYARKYGFRTRAITAAPQDSAENQVDVTYIRDPFAQGKRWSLAWVCERLLRQFVMPIEVGVMWANRVANHVSTQLIHGSDEPPLVLLSTFPPLGTHLAALHLARRHKLFWVADFRDPYSSSRSRSPVSTRLSLLVGKKLEQQIFDTASLVIANTEDAAAEMKHLYPQHASKIQVIWNGYDPQEQVTCPVLPQRQRKVITHTGALYGGRHAGPVLASLHRLIEQGRVPTDSVHMRLIGACSKGSLIPEEVVESGKRQGWLEIINDTVPHAQATQACEQADYLLLIQPHTGTQVPGKLFEYIRLGRPILAFIRKASPIERILEKAGIPYVAVYPEDAPERVDQAILDLLTLPSGPSAASSWFVENFDGDKQTQQLCSLISAALQKQHWRAGAPEPLNTPV